MFKPLDDKIVVFGMSCVGKTTFAKQLVDHHYYCFDAMFNWHAIESFGLSIASNLKDIRDQCVEQKFVLDGWHLADLQGEYLPDQAVVYVVYASYDQIISQYRVPVLEHQEHIGMYQKWYGFELLNVRYFRNTGCFVETSRVEYYDFLRTQSTNESDI